MKITDLSILCKWETLKNRQCIKYLFAPLYIQGRMGGHDFEISASTHICTTMARTIVETSEDDKHIQAKANMNYLGE